MIENDCPIPSCFADMFSKVDGWIETPEADPDADASASQKASADYLTWCVLTTLVICASSHSNIRSQLLWHNNSSCCIYSHNTPQHTSTSDTPNADNTNDNPAMSLTGLRLRLTCTATLALTVHQHGLDLHHPRR